MNIYLDDDSADRRLVAYLQKTGHQVIIPTAPSGGPEHLIRSTSNTLLATACRF